MTTAIAPYDAVLVLSFGGPEGPEDVLPFLRQVTAGRGIPDERLAVVGEHYYARGGRSPVNDLGRALVAALRRELAERGADVPVALGNRNWAPWLTDTLRDLHEEGARRVVTVLTSAYSAYSSCRQYREDLAAALATLADEGRRLDVDKVRVYWSHPGFATTTADLVAGAVAGVPAGRRASTRVAYVTHSIPELMETTSGPPEDPAQSYLAQHRALAAYADARVTELTGAAVPSDLVYCSRSGPPQQPWLEPDVNDHLEALAAAGVSDVVLAPIGFVSDHMEVVHDLDTEARATADRLGLTLVRVPTVGTDPRFVGGLADLVVERAARARGEDPARPAAVGEPLWDACPPGCCAGRRPLPTVCDAAE